jgi:hypothetical protein
VPAAVAAAAEAAGEGAPWFCEMNAEGFAAHCSLPDDQEAHPELAAAADAAMAGDDDGDEEYGGGEEGDEEGGDGFRMDDSD